MATLDEDRTLLVLDDADCRRLLAGQGVGRLGFSDGALPAIIPVSYFLRGDDVLIPADQRNPVVAAVRRAVVVFEVGVLDPVSRSGWSVSAVGPSRVITDPRAIAAIDAGGLALGPPAPSRCYISVQPGLLRGWRMGPPWDGHDSTWAAHSAAG
ncbi:hypothetical protein GCM10010531_12570 [Blastococcus jejuensis]|uniref:Pyridoxamine 5'-phosphate oxidase n=1 Tax=Blastococcus jejuensis TaxID=351224 RepID=A0ABP6NZ89_9ACTN